MIFRCRTGYPSYSGTWNNDWCAFDFRVTGESRESMLEGAIRLSELPIQVLKLHQLQIVKGTRLAEQYLENPALFHLYTLDEYLDFVVEVIERIRPMFTWSVS